MQEMEVSLNGAWLAGQVTLCGAQSHLDFE
jgi:hypothetical protein